MTVQTSTDTTRFSERERELGAIIKAYNEVTQRLKESHDRLNGELARLREELTQKNEELRRRDRLFALGEMSAGLAHEIRNPLGGIALYASMLERELSDRPGARDAATKISRGVRSLERLVSEILDFAQESRLRKQSCTLGPVLDQVKDGLEPWVDQTAAAVVMEPAAFDVRLDCDPFRLGRVLLNLMINGLQAVGSGGEVRLSARRVSPQGGEDDVVVIEVCDNGPGIPAELLDRIFNPFFTTRAAGTGLGLPIVHRIVEAHGGAIRAMNRAEGGARFVVRLPMENKD